MFEEDSGSLELFDEFEEMLVVGEGILGLSEEIRLFCRNLVDVLTEGYIVDSSKSLVDFITWVTNDNLVRTGLNFSFFIE